MPADADQPFEFREWQLRGLRHGKFLEELRIRSIAVGKAMERGAEQLGNRVAGKAAEWLHLDDLSCQRFGS